MSLPWFRLSTFAYLVVLLLSDAAFGVEPHANSEDVKIFSGEPRLLIVHGYSTSRHWWAMLQRKIDRTMGGPDQLKMWY